MDVAALHHAVMMGFVTAGRAPTAEELAANLGMAASLVPGALRDLAEDHGVLLHPDRPEIWVAHPFADAPTLFEVRTRERRWWAPCAWCAFGAAHLVGLGGEVTISTVLGAESEPARLVLHEGRLVDDDYVVHFPVPMRRAWDNVVYTCSVILLFRDADEVRGWCERHGVAMGDVQPVAVVHDFAREWYSRHLERDWRKWSASEAAQIFARHGLRGDIWEVEPDSGRF